MFSVAVAQLLVVRRHESFWILRSRFRGGEFDFSDCCRSESRGWFGDSDAAAVGFTWYY